MPFYNIDSCLLDSGCSEEFFNQCFVLKKKASLKTNSISKRRVNFEKFATYCQYKQNVGIEKCICT